MLVCVMGLYHMPAPVASVCKFRVPAITRSGVATTGTVPTRSMAASAAAAAAQPTAAHDTHAHGKHGAHMHAHGAQHRSHLSAPIACKLTWNLRHIYCRASHLRTRCREASGTHAKAGHVSYKPNSGLSRRASVVRVRSSAYHRSPFACWGWRATQLPLDSAGSVSDLYKKHKASLQTVAEKLGYDGKDVPASVRRTAQLRTALLKSKRDTARQPRRPRRPPPAGTAPLLRRRAFPFAARSPAAARPGRRDRAQPRSIPRRGLFAIVRRARGNYLTASAARVCTNEGEGAS